MKEAEGQGCHFHPAAGGSRLGGPLPWFCSAITHSTWARSYLSLWIWQSFTLSTLPSSSITLSLNWLLSSLEEMEGKSKSKENKK